MEHDSLHPNVFYAETNSLTDAQEFIHFKSFDGWKVLVQPYVSQQKYNGTFVERTGQSPDPVMIPTKWGFVLHRFHLVR